MKTFKLYLLEKRDHTAKIRKLANVDLIVDWANSLDKNLALWLARTLVEKIKDRHTATNKEKISAYLKGEKFEKLNEYVKFLMRRNRDDYITIVDYVNSTLHENKPQINKLTFDEALEQAKVFYTEAKIVDGILINGEDEEGCEVLMTFPDEYYWIDLKTTYSEFEAKAMQHCGRTTEGTTLISLREGGRPHVTIAWNENTNITSQIKGKQNYKPTEVYHKYIVDFIIKMGFEKHKTEYERREDFSPEDLSEELFEKLEQGNPDYISNSQLPDEKMLREEYKNRIIDDIEEYVSMYPYTAWGNIDDKAFIDSHIDEETEYYREDFESIDSFISGDAQEELSTWIITNSTEEIKIYVLENYGYGEEKLTDIEEILDDLTISDLVDVFKEFSLEYDFCNEIAKERYINSTAEEVYRNLYGSNALEDEHIRKNILSYLDEEGFAKDLESEMTYEDLLDYFGE